MKPLAIACSGVGKGLRGRDGGGDLTNVQCKSQCINPPFTEYILIKKIFKKEVLWKLTPPSRTNSLQDTGCVPEKDTWYPCGGGHADP
jgi:hypothetical protein